MGSILRSTPTHTHLNYSCLFKTSNRIRLAYLILYHNLIHWCCFPYLLSKTFEQKDKKKKKELLIDKNNVFRNHMVQVQTCDCTSIEEQLSWKRLFIYMRAHYNSLPFLKEFLEWFGYNLLGGHFFYWLQTTIQVFVHRHQQVVHSPHSSRS